jgi:hypothetical protein
MPEPRDWHDPSVMATLAYRLRRDRVEQLRDEAGAEHVFLFGTVDNELDAWDLFDIVICLVADDDTVRDRLANRMGNQFGKAQHELDAVLGWNQSMEENYRSFGAAIVDATCSVDEVAESVLRAAGVST